MKFLTRELYERQQRLDIPYEIRVAPWRSAVEARLTHLEEIKPHLQADMREFCDITLHDGRIQNARMSSTDLVLEIDSRGCPWGPRGQCTLTFRSVKDVDGLDECLGAEWLYEEVHLHTDAHFAYCVLLHKWNPRISKYEVFELIVIADEVEFQLTNPSPPPIIGVDIPFMGENGLYVWTNGNAVGDDRGWCFIGKDGKRVLQQPSFRDMEKLKRFARSIGAILPG